MTKVLQIIKLKSSSNASEFSVEVFYFCPGNRLGIIVALNIVAVESLKLFILPLMLNAFNSKLHCKRMNKTHNVLYKVAFFIGKIIVHKRFVDFYNIYRQERKIAKRRVSSSKVVQGKRNSALYKFIQKFGNRFLV